MLYEVITLGLERRGLILRMRDASKRNRASEEQSEEQSHQWNSGQVQGEILSNERCAGAVPRPDLHTVHDTTHDPRPGAIVETRWRVGLDLGQTTRRAVAPRCFV